MYMSCLFNSLNYFIKEGSDNIRQKVCDYLEENNPLHRLKRKMRQTKVKI